MALSQSIQVGATGGGRTLSKNVVDSADQRISQNFTVAGSTTDQEVALSIDVSEIKSIYIQSNQNITLETNSASVPDETLALLANEPYLWWTGSLFTNLLATDITTSFWTNGTTNVATVDIECVVDPTP